MCYNGVNQDEKTNGDDMDEETAQQILYDFCIVHKSADILSGKVSTIPVYEIQDGVELAILLDQYDVPCYLYDEPNDKVIYSNNAMKALDQKIEAMAQEEATKVFLGE